MTESKSLQAISQATRMLQSAETLEDIQQVRGLARMAAEYAKAAKLGRDAQNKAAEIKLRAERKAGEVLAGLERADHNRGNQHVAMSSVGHSQYKEALEESFTTRQDANRWQKIADIPEEDFEGYLIDTVSSDTGEITSAGALRLAARINRPEFEAPPPPPPDTYRVILADPPWRYEHVKTSNRAIENQYPTMTLEQICLLPIKDVADTDAVLFLWATSPKLEESMQVINSWGFLYRTCMVWVKDKIGMGYYARQQHELLLIARRGDMYVPEPSNRVSSVIHAPRTKHSEKPVEFYEAIETMYPDEKRIELFARNGRKGWDRWGNES